MSVAHEEDYTRRVSETGPTRFLPGTAVEIIREVKLAAPPRFALFDFDGTLSLVREGWPDVMIPMMVEELAATGTRESAAELTTLARNFVMELNGKQTIYQMIRLSEEIQARGGTPRDPLAYKERYHELLMQRIANRREALHSGAVPPAEMLVPHVYEALRALQERGVELYLASGTDENYVREEARLLGLEPYFGRHIYGAIDDHRKFSKQMVIERILRENKVEGARLIGLGDGYVEIANIKGAGGTAIAVASDEAGRSGKPDLWKRDRLIGVGADVVIPDFRDFGALCDYLWRGFAGRVSS
jgi:phosphoglycolate phosphatase-like HAD superfamily hydrolase